MTLEEAILAANNGDVERMNFLGQYYFGQKYLADSIAWFSRAAQAGDLGAAKKVDFLSKTLAAVCEEMGDWSGAFEFWTQYRDCQQLFIQTPQSVDNANFQYKKYEPCDVQTRRGMFPHAAF